MIPCSPGPVPPFCGQKILAFRHGLRQENTVALSQNTFGRAPQIRLFEIRAADGKPRPAALCAAAFCTEKTLRDQPPTGRRA